LLLLSSGDACIHPRLTDVGSHAKRYALAVASPDWSKNRLLSPPCSHKKPDYREDDPDALPAVKTNTPHWSTYHRCCAGPALRWWVYSSMARLKLAGNRS